MSQDGFYFSSFFTIPAASGDRTYPSLNGKHSAVAVLAVIAAGILAAVTAGVLAAVAAGILAAVAAVVLIVILAVVLVVVLIVVVTISAVVHIVIIVFHDSTSWLINLICYRSSMAAFA